jgi:2'-5' RNA ligase
MVHPEIHLRGYAKDHLREISGITSEEYHPHVTLGRPLKKLENENQLKQRIVEFCNGRQPIPFSLEGLEWFDENTPYVPVTNGAELLQFHNEFEAFLEGQTELRPKLVDEKVLHATVTRKLDKPCERIDQYMLRLTMVRDKKIWFSYDFVTQYSLTREQSLNKELWYRTVHTFADNFRLMPTRNGFVKI